MFPHRTPALHGGCCSKRSRRLWCLTQRPLESALPSAAWSAPGLSQAVASAFWLR